MVFGFIVVEYTFCMLCCLLQTIIKTMVGMRNSVSEISLRIQNLKNPTIKFNNAKNVAEIEAFLKFETLSETVECTELIF